MMKNKKIEDLMYDPEDLQIGDTIGRIDPTRINRGLFDELGISNEKGWSDEDLALLDDEDYEGREEASALALSQKYEQEMMKRGKDEKPEDGGKAMFREYQNKLSKYQSIFDRMQRKLVGKAIKGANEMYAPEGGY